MCSQDGSDEPRLRAQVIGWTNPGYGPKIATQLPRAATGGARVLFVRVHFCPLFPLLAWLVCGCMSDDMPDIRRFDEPCFGRSRWVDKPPYCLGLPLRDLAFVFVTAWDAYPLAHGVWHYER